MAWALEEGWVVVLQRTNTRLRVLKLLRPGLASLGQARCRGLIPD